MNPEQRKAVAHLIIAIKDRNGKPVNLNVVIATIESLGIREVDVEKDFGFDSILNLANYIYKVFGLKAYNDLKNDKQRVVEAKNYKKIAISSYFSSRAVKQFILENGSGISNFLPVAIQVISIVLFGISLWTFSKFNNLQSTAVVLGVIVGFVATGGFVQVIGKQVSYYWYNEDFYMARHSVLNIIKYGTLTILVIFIFSALLNFIIPLYSISFVIICFSYALFIGFLLLVLAPLYALKQRWMITVSISLGTALALALHFFTNVPVYFLHWAGIVVAALTSILYLQWFLKHTLKKKKSRSIVEPKVTLSIYRNFNYFLYGIFFFLFVFMDRIIAWSSSTNREIPYLFYYEKDYEIGMDLAILFFFLLGGVLEYSISSFNRHLDYFQLIHTYSKFKKFNRKMTGLYHRHLRLLLFTTMGVAILLYLIMTQPWGYKAGFDEALSELSIKVSILGSIGYIFLTIGVLNTLYLYTLNQNRKPLVAIIAALLTNFISGVILSRLISYEYAVVGLMLGSLVFMLVTFRYTKQFFKNLDYYYYAAY
ncbi:exopolysaccharide Pel transporter PelG [Christiangramia marina]|uniref:exopolysaccharide Pel transporter PelG n=1 Tax=Christiangramia marina TaxID=409436 RepID=UPI003AA88C93